MGAGNKALHVLVISKLISFKAVGAGGHMRLYWRTRPPAAEECIKLRPFSTSHIIYSSWFATLYTYTGIRGWEERQ